MFVFSIVFSIFNTVTSHVKPFIFTKNSQNSCTMKIRMFITLTLCVNVISILKTVKRQFELYIFVKGHLYGRKNKYENMIQIQKIHLK